MSDEPKNTPQKGVPPLKKKPKAYPFPATLGQNSVKKGVEVFFFNVTGLIARLNKHFVQVGEYYDLELVLPVTNHGIMTRVRVLKTYDKAVDPKEHKVERIAEFHFEKLTSEHRAAVQEFLRTVGSK